MKIKNYRNRFCMPLLAVALGTGAASAGVTESMAPAPAPAPMEDVISGSLSLAANSHFVSYGNDVWRDGNSMSHLEFNPSLEFTFALPENFSLILGTWWDVTDKGSPVLGSHIQEIDLWSGIGYTYDKFSITTTYQAWIYGGSTENILDVSLGYDCLLQPTLMFHNRLTIGASAGATGTVMVLGLSHTVDAGPVSVTFPVNFATFLGENFHGGNAGSDSGYGYTSLGAQASYPLAFLGSTYGDWSLDTGLNYFWTNGSVIPGNPSNHFLTYNFGLSASF